MAKQYKIEGEYKTANEVAIEITDTVPQPAKVITRTLTVKEISKRIAEIDRELINMAAEKADLQQVLDDNQTKINQAVKP